MKNIYTISCENLVPNKNGVPNHQNYYKINMEVHVDLVKKVLQSNYKKLFQHSQDFSPLGPIFSTFRKNGSVVIMYSAVRKLVQFCAHQLRYR